MINPPDGFDARTLAIRQRCFTGMCKEQVANLPSMKMPSSALPKKEAASKLRLGLKYLPKGASITSNFSSTRDSLSKLECADRLH